MHSTTQMLLRLFVLVLMPILATGCAQPYGAQPTIYDLDTLKEEKYKLPLDQVTDTQIIRFANNIRNVLRNQKEEVYTQGVALIEAAEIRFLEAIAAQGGRASEDKLTLAGVKFYQEVLVILKLVENRLNVQTLAY